MAFYYNPNFHEAPVWRGHPDDNTGNDEPEALGWIAPVISSDGKLFVAFSHVSDELKNLIDQKKFKYSSVEIKKYKLQDGTIIHYLWAMGLTNRAAVPGLEPLNFDSENFTLPKNFKQEHYKFTLENFTDEGGIRIANPINFNNQNSNNDMNQFLINTAKLFNLDLSKFTTDESLAEGIKVKFNENAANVTSLNTKITQLEANANPSGNTELTVMKAKIEKLKGEKVIELVDHAIEQKKILPKDKENYVLLAKANYDATKVAFSSMPVHPTLAGQVVNSAIPVGDINLEDPKFMKADGKKLTYDDITKTPSLIAKHKLTMTDVEALKKASE